MKRLCLIAILCTGLGPLTAMPQESGSLLVATEQIAEQTFAQTVILLLHFGDDGAIGIAINRPTWVTAREIFPEFESLHAYRDPIYHGGPLGQATVLVLSRSPSLVADDTEPLLDGVYVTSDLEQLEAELDPAADDSALRFYAGHASWGPGQLDEEIASGAWHVIPASAALVFDAEPESLWERVARVQSEMVVFERVSPRAIATQQ
jgi:putative transcriptional regulator